MMARIAMMKALLHGQESAPEPRKKAAKKYRIVSKGALLVSTVDNLITVFEINKLRDLKKHCRVATIHQRDFVEFIVWCQTSGGYFLHSAHHRHFIPGHLTLSDSDLAAIAANDLGQLMPAAQKAVNKVYATFEERRLLSGHLFWNEKTWHFFYFDNHDRDPHNNHWKGGPHIHLINHLWPNRSADSVWDEFRNANPIMRGALHIRFERSA